MNLSDFKFRGMTTFPFFIGIFVIFLLLVLTFLWMGDHGAGRLKTEYEKSMEKIRLVQTMRSDLLASAEAEKSAVMADRDEASRAFADQSLNFSQKVEKARLALQDRIEKGGPEAEPLNAFTLAWEKLKQIDQEILSLAVQNTNLKALRLSIGSAAAAMDRTRAALGTLMDWAAEPRVNNAGLVRLAARVLADLFKIYSLEEPHIAETADVGMDALEAQMKQLDDQATDQLRQLDSLVAGEGKAMLDEARNCLVQFQAVHRQVIGLSRQNTNIRSFLGSLGKKRQMMNLCLSRLDALQEVVNENATPKASR